MILIHVRHDDNEFATVAFLNEYTLKEAYEKARENGGEFSDETDDGPFDVKIHEFDGDMTSEAMDFIKETIGDYDMQKGEDLFLYVD